MNRTTFTVSSNVVVGERADDLSTIQPSPDAEETPQEAVTHHPIKPNLEGTGKTSNPLKSDPELVRLLKKLDTITKYKSFHRWKKSFLDRLLPHIVTDQKQKCSLQVADEASEKFDTILAKTARQANEVLDKESRGGAVQATLALRELGNLLQQTTETVQEWIPASTQEEKQQGYTKFHLGAALIQQGFPQYVAFMQMDQVLQEIKESLEDEDDNELLESTLQAYFTQVERFCDVLADLGIYEIAKKCHEFAVAPDVEESSDDEGMEIFLEGETVDGEEECVAMDLEPGETLADSTIMTIESEFGIPPSELVLTYKGQQLLHQTTDKDKSMCKELGIRDGDTLKVQLRKLNLILHSDYGTNEEDVDMTVTCRNTLQDIKEKVASSMGIPVNQQRVFRHQARTVELSENNSTVLQYGLEDQEYLVIEPSFINLRVETPDPSKSFDVEIGLDDTTADIKEQIAEETGFSTESFMVLCNKHNQEMPACQTLRDSVLCNNDVLTMKLNLIPITVMRKSDDSKLKEIVLHPLDSTLGFIKEELHEVSGVAPGRQHLYYKGKELEGDSENVLALGLKPNAMLWLDEGPTIITSSGDIYMSYTLNIDEAPKEREYKELAKVTKTFYAKHLKKEYPNSFQSLRVAPHKTLFEANLPNAKYNVYVEWAFLATFEGADAPSRHTMCNYLVELDLAPYLAKVSKMPQRSFSKTKGVYTQHTEGHALEEESSSSD